MDFFSVILIGFGFFIGHICARFCYSNFTQRNEKKKQIEFEKYRDEYVNTLKSCKQKHVTEWSEWSEYRKD